MNVLLTCAGRRSYLVQFFQRALGLRGQVIACDASASAPALLAADRTFVVPAVDHAEYFEVLESICREQSVSLLFSVNEMELRGLAQRAASFREFGTTVVVSAPEVIATCQDKWSAYCLLRDADIPAPKTFLSLDETRQALARREIRFPLLIKPRWGVSSMGIERIECDHELDLAQQWSAIRLKRCGLVRMSRSDPERPFVFQECLSGQEYGMDVVNDLNGNYACTLARRKLAMRAGCTDRAVTVEEPRLERLGRVLARRLRHLGNLDCDVMANDDGCFVLDLNPRFGGGYPFSHLAGADVPAALVAWAECREPDPAWLRSRPGVLTAIFDGLAVVDGGVESHELQAELAAVVS